MTIIPSSTIRVITDSLAPLTSFVNGFDDSLNTITIDRYQTVYLQVRGQDISGTHIIANKPISVFLDMNVPTYHLIQDPVTC